LGLVFRLVADENFNRDIIRGLARRYPDLDLVRVQDVEMAGAEDPAILERAANEGRILITHDVNTMPRFTFERIAASWPTPGVFLVSGALSVGEAIDELLLLSECSLEDEWEGRVHYVPPRY
jgi:hypothetical protein